MYELIYTSAVKGLLPGRSGFTTVAVSRGMPPNLITPLENLSGYNFTLQDNKFLAEFNPVCCYYIKLQYGNQLLRVVGRIAPNGLDYSKRNNKIAHHLLLESGDDLASYTGGAAEIFDTPDMFASDFNQQPCELGVKHLPPPFNKNILPAKTWADFSGDESMAAWVGNEFRKHPHDALYLAYPANTPSDYLLQLVKEVCALLEPAERYDFTFNTYFGNGNAASECFLRFLPDFSPILKNIRQIYPQKLLEPGKNMLAKANINDPLCEFARSGNKPLPEPANNIVSEISAAQNQFVEVNQVPDITVSAETPAIEHTATVRQQKFTPTDTSYRKPLLITVAGILLLICLCGILQITGESSPEQPSKSSGEPAEKQLYVKVKQPVYAVKQSNRNNVQPVIIKPETSVAPKPLLAPIPVKSRKNAFSADKKLYLAAEKLPLQDRLQLFIDFQKLISCSAGQVKLPLPETLQTVTDFSIFFDRIGNQPVKCHDFLKLHNSTTLSVAGADSISIPLTPIAGSAENIPQLKLQISEDKHFLKIMPIGASQGVILPSISNIKRFYFKTANKVYFWESEFDVDCLTLLKPGKVILTQTGKIMYFPTQDEMMLANFVRRSFGKAPDATIRSKSFYFTEWNKAVKNYYLHRKRMDDLQKQLASEIVSYKPLYSRKECLKRMKDMEELAENNDLKMLQFEMNKFLNHFFCAGTLTRTTAVSSDIAVLPEKLCEKLFDVHIEKDSPEGKNLLKLKNLWQQRISKLQSFEQIKKDMESENKKLDQCQRSLQLHAETAFTTASSIHQDVKYKLQSCMNFSNTEKVIKASVITEKHRLFLSEAIAEHIHFTPISGENVP